MFGLGSFGLLVVGRGSGSGSGSGWERVDDPLFGPDYLQSPK